MHTSDIRPNYTSESASYRTSDLCICPGVFQNETVHQKYTVRHVRSRQLVRANTHNVVGGGDVDNIVVRHQTWPATRPEVVVDSLNGEL